MDDDVTEYPTRRLRLQECHTCGRQFNAEIINKHQAICRKVSTKKRKVFDTGKQRATDSDVPYKATKQTAQIYNGEAPAQDTRSKYGSKPNWREKHNQLVRSIREARSVTRAIKEGGPLPAFRPSEVPSDYVNCPHCHRNFNRNAAERHIPFCQSQNERKQVHRSNQQYDRGRSLPPQPPQQQSQYRQQQQQPPPPQQPQYRQQQQQPPQHQSQYRQQHQPPPHQQSQYRQQQQKQTYSTSAYSNSDDVYNNGYKHSNSAPMIVRRRPQDYQQQEQPPPPPPQKTSSEGWGFRKLFGSGSKQDSMPSSNYGTREDDDYYEPPTRRPMKQQPVLMRTGRTQQNTSLNVQARQRSGDEGSQVRRIPPPQASSSYGQHRNQYDSNPYQSMRPTAVGRPPLQTAVRCGDCGGVFTNMSSRYCPQCGSRR